MKVVLDPGHGGVQPGAAANGLVEKDITLAICYWAQQYLINKGFDVVMTRNDDRSVTLTKRVMAPGDIFISVHCNAGGGQGLETWHQKANPYAPQSVQLAKQVHSAILRHVAFKDRGLRTRLLGNGDFFFVLRQNKRPAILVECGFIDNPNDALLLSQGNVRMLIGKAIAEGVEVYAASQKS